MGYLCVPHIDEFNGDGSTAAFTLTQVPSVVMRLILSYLLTMFIRGMVQVMHLINGATLTLLLPPVVLYYASDTTITTKHTKYCCRWAITQAKLSFDPHDDLLPRNRHRIKGIWQIHLKTHPQQSIIKRLPLYTCP